MKNSSANNADIGTRPAETIDARRELAETVPYLLPRFDGPACIYERSASYAADRWKESQHAFLGVLVLLTAPGCPEAKAEAKWWYDTCSAMTRAIARRIEQTGKRVDDLTVRELRALCRTDWRELAQNETPPTTLTPEAP